MLTTSLLDVRYRKNPKGISGQLVLGKDLCKVFGLVNTGPVSPSTDILMMYRVLLGTDRARSATGYGRYDRTEQTRFGSTGTELGSVQAERTVSTARFGPNRNTSS